MAKRKAVIGSKKPLIVPDEVTVKTVDISQVPFLLNAAGIRVIYHGDEGNHRIPTSSNYTVSVINSDGSETPLSLVQSIKFELDVDDVPVITLSYIDSPTR